MKTTVIFAAVALVVAAGGTASAMSVIDKQEVGLSVAANGFEGTSWDCLDYNALYNSPAVHSPLAETFEVTPGAGWTASSSEGYVHVDFHSDNGLWVGYGTDEGTVPSGAAYAVACVGQLNAFPDVPAVGATFTYTEI